MEENAENTDQGFDQQVAPQKLSQPRAVPRHDPGPERHSTHEYRQHQGLCVRRVPEEELEVVRPDGFVDESGESGDYEYAEQKPAARTVEIRHGSKSLG